MDNFRTIVKIPEFPWKMDYGENAIFIGSCFTENIGGKLLDLKFNIDLNPFGILYNPISIANSINILLERKLFAPEDLILHDGLWHSFYHHSRFSSADQDETLNTINQRIGESAKTLQNADFLFITFGTSWIYELVASGQVVSNCHKIPAKEFRRYRLSVEEIVDRYNILLKRLWEVNPKIKVVFTVSPIRHWKDGAVENQLSKATLLLAINKIINELGEERCAYFPSYELVMDDLRDYRFYADDMIHLSSVAINYIWEKFEMALIDPDAAKLSKEVQKIINATNHRPFNPNTKEHLKFLRFSLNKARQLVLKYMNLNLKLEIESFEQQISELAKITDL